MSTDKNFNERNRDIQDGIERHVWGKLAYQDKAGAMISVRGTGTSDEEAVVLNAGYAFNLDDNTNCEVFLLAGGSDMSQKFAVLSLPRDKQRQWGKNKGGIQNPVDPDKAVEFNEKRIWNTDPNFAVGPGGIFEVLGDTVYIRGNLVVAGDLGVNGNLKVGGAILGPLPSGGGTTPIPGFEE